MGEIQQSLWLLMVINIKESFRNGALFFLIKEEKYGK